VDTISTLLDIIVNKPIDQKVVELSSSQRYSLVENSMYHSVFLLKAYNKMTFSYNQVKERPKLFLAMTGLTHAEFEQLLPHFQGALDQYVQDNYIDRDKRQRQYGGGKSESTLITIEDKLLFILYYVKVYPLQEILAFEFDMVQSTANDWIHILSGVLQKALDHGGYLPERDPKQLETVLESEPESIYGIDGTERPRQRPCDAEKQKHYSSGKKKRTPSSISLLAVSIRAKSII
jgi:DDE superfamily endonuclease